jgi:ribosomal protein S18 acetylase RimI-like enzyme
MVPTSDPQIMLASPADAPAAMGILRHCVADMNGRGVHQWDEVYPDHACVQADIAAGELFLAVEGSAPVALVVLNESQEKAYAKVPWRYCQGRALVVHRLAVDPKHQRRGWASKLMDFAEREAAARGCTGIRLDAFARNSAAIRLYARLGYRNAGTVQFRKGPFCCFEKRVC